jgi:hypothetical protein
MGSLMFQRIVCALAGLAVGVIAVDHPDWALLTVGVVVSAFLCLVPLDELAPLDEIEEE